MLDRSKGQHQTHTHPFGMARPRRMAGGSDALGKEAWPAISDLDAQHPGGRTRAHLHRGSAVRGDLVWENSLASALAMERIARKQGAEDEQAAYTIGLLRSAGKVLFTRLASQPGQPIAPYPGAEVEPHLGDWERGLFGMDNPEAAAELMEHWKFDPTIRQAIRHHL